MSKKNPTFEEAVGRLESIVKELESGELPLSDSLKLFEEGSGLVGLCTKMLDEAGQKVTLLRSNTDGEAEEVPFDEQEL